MSLFIGWFACAYEVEPLVRDCLADAGSPACLDLAEREDVAWLRELEEKGSSADARLVATHVQQARFRQQRSEHEPACEAGDLDACLWMASCRSTGLGCERDEAAALELYRQACDGGRPLGCTGLEDLQRRLSEQGATRDR